MWVTVLPTWDDQWLRPRFVYVVPPSENEQELVSLFGTYLVADFVSHKVDERKEVLSCPQPLTLGPGEDWAYLRHEPNR